MRGSVLKMFQDMRSTAWRAVVRKQIFLCRSLNSTIESVSFVTPLSQSSRPDRQAFDEFYKNSIYSAFWGNEVFPAVLEARREKIFQPRVARRREECVKLGIKPKKLIDTGSGHGVFLEEWKKVDTETQLLAVEPSDIMAKICRQKGF